jgi:uncharacterized protein YcaQ
MISIGDLRRFTVARSLFAPTTLQQAIARLGFVQADPIRAPARRAQDLILRHRVRDYKVADLERRYSTLGIEEDYFRHAEYAPSARDPSATGRQLTRKSRTLSPTESRDRVEWFSWSCHVVKPRRHHRALI